MKFAYPYTATPQESGGFFVQFIDIEEAITEGDTLEDAAFNAAEVLTGVLAYRLDHGQEIPPPSDPAGRPVAVPSGAVQAVMVLREARGDRPIADLARGLDTSWAAAQRLDNPHHWPSLKQLDRAARVLGKRLVLSIE
ncbi:MAG: type II toxin-antitoxin system HicB family antitoxin [Giesbergeria sp.]|uniref:type II toxin-antitoxin system HicB family antitoxin n=1 Tax=Giesbergeria sp. TaxID=2818473 RepID=UPI002615E2A2|nr:type II toxin-antitoxin system HicB family antitoxin [Giesbergeria sp.]MDD2608943.1 type II toxin-antitoxin system HicB family antitoxin [Giesbergeria sp.]